MEINKKAVKLLERLCEAGFTDEKKIGSMSIEDVLSVNGIRIEDVALINDLQKRIKSNRVISFFITMPDSQKETMKMNMPDTATSLGGGEDEQHEQND